MSDLTDVLKIQQMLNDSGADLVADGITGPATVAAIKQFQLENGLLPDGRISEELIASLNKSLSDAVNASPSIFSTALDFAVQNKKPLIILSSIAIFGYGIWFLKSKMLRK